MLLNLPNEPEQPPILSCTAAGQEGAIRVSLSYLHPGSATEVDFLFGGAPAKKLKPRKRRHGRRHVAVGAAAPDLP